MRLPVLHGIIRRRILVNYRVDPQVIRSILPARFEPKLQKGHAIAGICLIRLEQIRPSGVPGFVGINSENAAHRVAVTWMEEDGTNREGVFIPRRDTNSSLNHLLGRKVFPGEHHLATFEIEDAGSLIDFRMFSDDRSVCVELKGTAFDSLPDSSIFNSLSEASSFFEAGSLGYSAREGSDLLDAIRLEPDEWHVDPLKIDCVFSSYFSDEARFPQGTAVFDHALIMRNVPHHWRVTS